MATSSSSAEAQLLADHHASSNVSDAPNDDPRTTRSKRTAKTPARYNDYILEPPKTPRKAPSALNAPPSKISPETNSITTILSFLTNVETKLNKLKAANDSLKEIISKFENTVSHLSSSTNSVTPLPRPSRMLRLSQTSLSFRTLLPLLPDPIFILLLQSQSLSFPKYLKSLLPSLSTFLKQKIRLSRKPTSTYSNIRLQNLLNDSQKSARLKSKT
jgi:hypothetical protein